ncbi:bacteriocin immunity protein (plasmid) [Clostridium estertheticum]|uniref:Bacteriocin immunity protein n=1 Tax=Clostridium estertheticum TaxID=238834 RepID=A0A5N7IV01_9CLOT|nr:bacteriocin immunity protein [Clostridium estertheticum]MBX4262759.1 bacteriocin immunity protein [Clostridium estertheticum]MPQ34137.1 bacteriocin immunity protein [Clostridium estertheticum]MPQ64739.1 bacteriocin immunity protein [Clostridium estertheticum]WLC72797.1 bacteriocin immunity protein [Clostridium estertheticum]
MKKKKDEQTAISLFDTFKRLILEKSSQDNRYSRILNVLNRAIERVAKGTQTPQLEARSAFQNICTLCFVDKIKLNAEEADALQKIDDFSHSKGIWGEMNTLSISNMWLSN